MFKLTTNKLKRAAFTLAEVLITLTIIGVIAAMTIPTLMSKNRDQVAHAKLKKAQAVFANALSMANAQDGPIDFSGGWHNENNDDRRKILGYLKTSRELEDLSYVFSKTNGNMIVAYTEDGMIFGIHPWQNRVAVCLEKTDASGECITPYQFELLENRTIVPVGTPQSDTVLKESTVCSQKSYDWDSGACTYWLLKTGKINKAAGEWDDKLRMPSSD